MKGKPRIIAFTGKMGVGKSTACKFFTDQPDCEKLGFKDALLREVDERMGPVLDIASTLYNIPREELFQKKPPLIRALLQNYGTEVRRRDDENYWAKQWKSKAYSELLRGNSVVVDDVRFLNEAEAVRELGGIIVRLTRPDITTTGSHQSELEMDAIVPDHVIETQPGDLAALKEALAAL